MEEAVKDMAAARSLQPSAVAAGPKGLAFMSLRADLKKLEEKLESRFTEFKSDLSDVRAAVNVASMSAGAAPPGIGVDGNAMQELEKLEEAMEERFAMIQGQIESLAVNVGGECPCVSGRCPCKCNGAPIKEPPKRREDDEDEFIKKDPWKRFARRGDGGGDGDGGGGHGDDGDAEDGADDFFIGTPNGGKGLKKAHEYEYGKPFEAKDAKS